MAKFDDLPNEIVAIIARHATASVGRTDAALQCSMHGLSYKSGKIIKPELALRLVSRQFATFVAEGVLHELLLADQYQGLFKENDNGEYIKSVACFIEKKGLGPSISSIHLALSNGDPEILAAIRKVLRLAIGMRELHIWSLGSHRGASFPALFLPEASYTRLSKLTLISKNAFPLLRYLVDQGARPTQLTLARSGHPSDSFGPEIQQTGAIFCSSVDRLVVHGRNMAGYQLLEVSPVRFELTHACHFEKPWNEILIDTLLDRIGEPTFSKRLRVITLQEVSSRLALVTRKFFSFCREKGLSLGARGRKEADIEWLCIDGELTAEGEDVARGIERLAMVSRTVQGHYED